MLDETDHSGEDRPEDLTEADYQNCRLCPHECGVNRAAGQVGICRCTDRLLAARAALHMWEEPCISGKEGSGAVFFSGCTLGCVYCQNRAISRAETGREITEERLEEIFLELQSEGANNINLVTPGHFLPTIRTALIGAKRRGLHLPVLMNTGGYERPEVLRKMEGLIDIYLPDFKYMDPNLAARYSHCPDYPEKAAAAVDEMVSQCPAPEFDDRGMMTRGVIVRHLVLPGHTEDSREVIRYLHDRYGNSVYLSIMSQYTPMPGIENTFPELARKTTMREYNRVVDFAIDLGVENGFIQEGKTAEESFIPPFDETGL